MGEVDTARVSWNAQEQRIAPFEEDEGCVGQLSEAIKHLSQKKGSKPPRQLQSTLCFRHLSV